MNDIYREKYCPQCAFKGSVFNLEISGIPIKHIDCQRDNEGAKDHFRRTRKDENYEWARQEVEFLHCIYDNPK
ncbi:hypothetical protein FACS189483_07290 [Spirochaetia bacterium]|nr:hypothetical protein FACS189483_07290 [Spirochaetia bacterium]